jgi:two-component system response regulator AtoC
MTDKSAVLIVEANAGDGARGALTGGDFQISTARTWEEGRRRLETDRFDLLLLDLALVGNTGLEAVTEARDGDTPPEVVVLTASPSPEEAVAAVKLGAFQYLGKPVDPEALRRVAERAASTSLLQRENSALKRIVSQQDTTTKPIAKSPKMAAVLERIERIASSPASVLIHGETGSGKGLVARVIHQGSDRAERPFVHVNCGALQEQLLESELFGHEKGAFTGASGTKPGLFEVAHSGTLFLDEIGELTSGMQAKLLQVLDSGELRRVGGTQLHRVDTRVLAATNKSLKQEVRDGRFRQDLYFRLNVVHLAVPALRDRREDIPGLVAEFLKRYRIMGQVPKKISRRALALLMGYHWPGNVRELANTIESVCLLSPGETILPEDLPPPLQPSVTFESRSIDIPLPLTEMERLHIVRALDYTDGKKAPAARLLRIDVKTLSNKIKSYGIEF